jgi:hypothetical protein
MTEKQRLPLQDKLSGIRNGFDGAKISYIA